MEKPVEQIHKLNTENWVNQDEDEQAVSDKNSDADNDNNSDLSLEMMDDGRDRNRVILSKSDVDAGSP